MTEELQLTVTDVPTGTVGEVLDWVGDDLKRCQLALKVEQNGKRRATLVSALTELRDSLAAADKREIDPDEIDPDEIDPDRADAAKAAAAAEHVPQGEELDRKTAEGGAMCAEHFPLGWNSPAVVRTEAATGVRQPNVTCEHGTYTRP